MLEPKIFFGNEFIVSWTQNPYCSLFKPDESIVIQKSALKIQSSRTTRETTTENYCIRFSIPNIVYKWMISKKYHRIRFRLSRVLNFSTRKSNILLAN